MKARLREDRWFMIQASGPGIILVNGSLIPLLLLSLSLSQSRLLLFFFWKLGQKWLSEPGVFVFSYVMEDDFDLLHLFHWFGDGLFPLASYRCSDRDAWLWSSDYFSISIAAFSEKKKTGRASELKCPFCLQLLYPLKKRNIDRTRSAAANCTIKQEHEETFL